MEKNEKVSGRPSLLREINLDLIKNTLAEQGKATRVEIAGITKISQPTVNQLFKDLLADGTIVSCGEAQSTGGRKAETFMLNPKRAKLAIVKAHQNSIEAYTADLDLKTERRRILQRKTGSSYLEQMIVILRKLKAEEPMLSAISVGVPGAVSQEGKIFAIPQIPEWEDMALGEMIEKELSLPVSVINDVNAAAVGIASEWKSIRNLAYIYMEGQGIGAGFVLDGKLYEGSGSFAGELGYMQIGNLRAEEMEINSLLVPMVINLICVLNPEAIFFGGQDYRESVRQLRIDCERYLPARVVPQMNYIEDTKKYYELGLGTLGIEIQDRGIYVMGGIS